MPDIQTEVQKIINSWNLPVEEVTTTPVTEKKSFCESVYDHIKANPQCSLETLRTAFNIDKDDVAGLASSLKTLYDRQLIGRAPIVNKNYKGFGRRMVFVYWAVSNTYTMQVKGLYSKKKKVVKVVSKKYVSVNEATKRMKQATVDAQNVEKFTKPAVLPVHASVKDLVNSLNIYQARELWAELNKVFGKQIK
jgi:hypothetical protein